MNKQQSQQNGKHQTEAEHRPGAGAVAGVALQQQQAAEAEHHAQHGKYVDKPGPRGAGVAALVQVIQVGDPASVGGLELQRAGFDIQA